SDVDSSLILFTMIDCCGFIGRSDVDVKDNVVVVLICRFSELSNED
ncbi:unnamed protein product, partial [Rotaria sordida]